MSGTTLPEARYEYGGDEFVFVEIDEQMSIEANFKAMMIANALRSRDLDGIVDICPSNASYMMPSWPPDAILIFLITDNDSRSNIVTVESPPFVMKPCPELGASAIPCVRDGEATEAGMTSMGGQMATMARS